MKIFYFIVGALLIFPQQSNHAQQAVTDTTMSKDVDGKKMEEKFIAAKVRNRLDSINTVLKKLNKPDRSKPTVMYKVVTVYRDTCGDRPIIVMQPPTSPDTVFYNEPVKKKNIFKRFFSLFGKKHKAIQEE